MPSNTARIAKNTLALYFRQILIMLVSLYTVRVVLETLGAEDYGIYNVVAGVVTMFGFLSASMATATQRYLLFEIGRGDFEQLKKIFSLSFEIYVLIAVIVLVLAETAGLWLVSNKLMIPIDRKDAALWIYQFAIISCMFSILISPYMAAIISHEDMNIYAYVSIVEAVLKLGIVFLLQVIQWDNLKLYGLLLCSVAVVVAIVYFLICYRKYPECKISYYWNRQLFKEITSYTGWNLFGSMVGIFKIQGVNILLNQYFNPLVVTARGIAATVNSAVVSFSGNFSTALRPQIIKSYAAGNKKETLKIMFYGSKGAYSLMYLFTLPLVLEAPAVLSLWLKNPPEYTVLFTRLALIDALIDSISYPIMAAAQATGKIKLYQSVVGGILLLNLPVSWAFLVIDAPAYTVMLAAICLTSIAFIVRLLILKRLIDYSMIHFLKEVFIPVITISLLSAIIPFVIYSILEPRILQLLLVTGISILSVCGCAYMFGLSDVDREKLKSMLQNRMHYDSAR
jgi:O-antigen/teichoic acid export membrane protein